MGAAGDGVTDAGHGVGVDLVDHLGDVDGVGEARAGGADDEVAGVAVDRQGPAGARRRGG
jgi:hypothetical protein